jgi:hypothetical protein
MSRQLDFGAANAAHSDKVRNVAVAKIGSPRSVNRA